MALNSSNNTQSSLQSKPAFGYSDSTKVTKAVFFSIEAVLILLTNTVLLLAIRRLRSKADGGHMIIASFSVAFLLLALVDIPLSVMSEYYNPGIEWRDFCFLKQGCTHFVSLVTAWSLTLVAAERYVAVRFPFGYQAMMTRTNALIACSVLYILCFLLAFLPAMGLHVEPLPATGKSCRWTFFMISEHLIFNVYMFTIVPFVFVGMFQIWILIIAHQQVKRIRSTTVTSDLSARELPFRRHKSTYIVAGLVFFLIAIWLPSNIVIDIRVIAEGSPPTTFVLTAIGLRYIGGIVTPLILGMTERGLKAEMRSILGRCYGNLASSNLLTSNTSESGNSVTPLR